MSPARDSATGRFSADAPPVDPAKIKARRIALGLRQDEVASLTGASQGNISHVESGRRNPSLHLLQMLAKVLDCDVDDFAPGGGAA